MQYPQQPSQPFRVETLAPSLIGLLVLSCVQPLVVIATTAMPYAPDDPIWRGRLYALLLGTAPQLGVCLVLIAAIGIFSERYAPVRWSAIAALAIAALLVPILMLDALDVIQIQQQVPLDLLRRYRINGLQTWFFGAIMVPTLVWVGIRGLQAGKKAPEMDISDALLLNKEPLPGPLDPRVTN